MTCRLHELQNMGKTLSKVNELFQEKSQTVIWSA